MFRGGLKIYTTYDPVLQWMAASAVSETLPPTAFVAAVVVIDNSDGSVRAMYTGKDFSESQFNPDHAQRAPDRFLVQGVHARHRARCGLLARTTASAAAQLNVEAAR